MDKFNGTGFERRGMMRKLVVIIAVIGLVVSYLPVIAGEGVGEGGSYVSKQEGIQ